MNELFWTNNFNKSCDVQLPYPAEGIGRCIREDH